MICSSLNRPFFICSFSSRRRLRRRWKTSSMSGGVYREQVSLIRKLAIEVRSATLKNALKTYVVFSYEEILRRRRAAGLTHYVKRTGLVPIFETNG
jgi:hypothetical protein